MSSLPDQYREPFAESFPHRERQHVQMKAYLESLPERQPGPVVLDAALPRQIPRPQAQVRPVSADAVADIYRVWVEFVEGVELYGLYLQPRGFGVDLPLLIALHGGSGCPEAICALDDRANYHAFGRAAAARGYAVWAPGLVMRVSYGGDPRISGGDRTTLFEMAKARDLDLRLVEARGISLALQALLEARPELDGERVAMAGLSMGGVYTLLTMAIDPGIWAGVVAGGYGSGATAADPASAFPSQTELAALICPRPLMVQHGIDDAVIPVEGARRGAEATAALYEQNGAADNFEYSEHPGAHEFEIEGIFEFLSRRL
jgi:dienelactone hydrolase